MATFLAFKLIVCLYLISVFPATHIYTILLYYNIYKIFIVQFQAIYFWKSVHKKCSFVIVYPTETLVLNMRILLVNPWSGNLKATTSQQHRLLALSLSCFPEFAVKSLMLETIHILDTWHEVTELKLNWKYCEVLCKLPRGGAIKSSTQLWYLQNTMTNITHP